MGGNKDENKSCCCSTSSHRFSLFYIVQRYSERASTTVMAGVIVSDSPSSKNIRNCLRFVRHKLPTTNWSSGKSLIQIKTSETIQAAKTTYHTFTSLSISLSTSSFFLKAIGIILLEGEQNICFGSQDLKDND